VSDLISFRVEESSFTATTDLSYRLVWFAGGTLRRTWQVRLNQVTFAFRKNAAYFRYSSGNCCFKCSSLGRSL
jgi:hypothetical protein